MTTSGRSKALKKVAEAEASGAIPRRAHRFLTAAGRDPEVFREIPGDVGSRRYYRGLSPEGTPELLALYGPKDVGLFDRWFATAAVLEEHVRLPAVYYRDRAVPAALIEDFGPTDLSAAARAGDQAQVERLFVLAAETAAALRRIAPPVAGELNPPLDAPLFRIEMETTRREFFSGLYGQRWNNRLRVAYDEWVFRLAERLDALPRLSCHRDFHGNNLFPLEDGQIGLIDFQGLRPGPLGYDLASLLFERTAVDLIDEELADDIVRSYARRLGLGVSDLTRAVMLCRLERGWKAIGTFAGQVRAGHESYREFLDLQVDSMVSVVERDGDCDTKIPDFVWTVMQKAHAERQAPRTSAKQGGRTSTRRPRLAKS